MRFHEGVTWIGIALSYQPSAISLFIKEFGRQLEADGYVKQEHFTVGGILSSNQRVKMASGDGRAVTAE
jgi:hypothetical protein